MSVNNNRKLKLSITSDGYTYNFTVKNVGFGIFEMNIKLPTDREHDEENKEFEPEESKDEESKDEENKEFEPEESKDEENKEFEPEESKDEESKDEESKDVEPEDENNSTGSTGHSEHHESKEHIASHATDHLNESEHATDHLNESEHATEHATEHDNIRCNNVYCCDYNCRGHYSTEVRNLPALIEQKHESTRDDQKNAMLTMEQMDRLCDEMYGVEIFNITELKVPLTPRNSSTTTTTQNNSSPLTPRNSSTTTTAQNNSSPLTPRNSSTTTTAQNNVHVMAGKKDRGALPFDDIVGALSIYDDIRISRAEDIKFYREIFVSFDMWLRAAMNSNNASDAFYASIIDIQFCIHSLKIAKKTSDPIFSLLIGLLRKPIENETVLQMENRQKLASIMIACREGTLDSLLTLFNTPGCTCERCAN